MRVFASSLVLVILLAGCAEGPGPSTASPTPGASPAASPGATPTPAVTPAATPPATTPAATPATSPPTGIWEGFVEVTLTAEPTTARAGEEIRLTLTAKDRRETSIWTNPGFSCGGSWNVEVRDASGALLRVDDRDAMGCPTTDTYDTEIRPGEETSVVYTWDGNLRPTLGQAEPAPPGRYTVTGTVRYATERGTSNGSGPSAAEESATVVVEIAG